MMAFAPKALRAGWSTPLSFYSHTSFRLDTFPSTHTLYSYTLSLYANVTVLRSCFKGFNQLSLYPQCSQLSQLLLPLMAKYPGARDLFWLRTQNYLSLRSLSHWARALSTYNEPIEEKKKLRLKMRKYTENSMRICSVTSIFLYPSGHLTNSY